MQVMSALAVVSALMLGFLACAPRTAQAPAPSSAVAPRTQPVRLVVLITVDQMRADYVQRFRGQLAGGIARLYDGGAVFTRAVHDHALTETAPGHAAMLSGRFPVHTGITTNVPGVGDAEMTLVDAPGRGASPHRFRGTTLVDWIRAKEPAARVLSISKKDRGAILPIGRSKVPVFWYADNGIFTTSTYYADTLPTWLREFNARRLPFSYAGRAWTPLLPDSAYPEPDSVPAERHGRGVTFPHWLPADPTAAVVVRTFEPFPWIDEVTLAAALAGVRAMQLGAGARTDLLSVSLSATDAVGHMYGPDSKEMHDQILRLDRMLGAFLDTLFTLRDSGSVVIAFTSDHGVGPIPGVRSRDLNERSGYVDLSPAFRRVHATLRARGVGAGAFRLEYGTVTIDRPALRAARFDADSLVDAFRDSVLAVPGVLRADRIIGELQHGDTVRDTIARRWLHMFDTDSVAALVVTLAPYHYWIVAYGTADHGSPHDYDAHVPLIFYGAPFRVGSYDVPVRVVDLAPTLAAVLGVRPSERMDGRVLSEALR